jgi:hypothetical protein
MNERDFPHIVELRLPAGGFRSQSDDMLAFAASGASSLVVATGGTNDEQYYVRYCFADPAHADASVTSSAVRGLHRPLVAAGRAGELR